MRNLTILIAFILGFGCLAEEKTYFPALDRYVFDKHIVGSHFIDFYNQNMKTNDNIKPLGYINYGNEVRCYQFDINHSVTGYNRLDMYVTGDNKVIKTFLYFDNEVPIMTEKEEWMKYLHLKKGVFIEEAEIGRDALFQDPNWCQRQIAWCYEAFVPSQEFVDKCTPSKETMKTVGMVVLITGAVILVIFAGASAMKSAVK